MSYTRDEALIERATREWTDALVALPDLLPCPWCGARPIVYLAFIGCANRLCPCAAKVMGMTSLFDDFGPVAQRLHARWNTRPEQGTSDARRLDALDAFIDKQGEARFSKWANEMVELDGFYTEGGDDDEMLPMFDSLRDLLDELANVFEAEVAMAREQSSSPRA